jgi:hypothetical protein
MADEVGKLSVELKAKLTLEEHQKLAQQKLEKEIEYYKGFILTTLEASTRSVGGTRSSGSKDKMAKDVAFDLLKNLLKKHGITRGYVNHKEAGVPLGFLDQVPRRTL